jgi:hypothetical protein
VVTSPAIISPPALDLRSSRCRNISNRQWKTSI